MLTFGINVLKNCQARGPNCDLSISSFPPTLPRAVPHVLKTKCDSWCLVLQGRISCRTPVQPLEIFIQVHVIRARLRGLIDATQQFCDCKLKTLKFVLQNLGNWSRCSANGTKQICDLCFCTSSYCTETQVRNVKVSLPRLAAAWWCLAGKCSVGFFFYSLWVTVLQLCPPHHTGMNWLRLWFMPHP